MEEIKAYKAADGKIFTDKADCERYEIDVLFEKKKGALHRRINLTIDKVDALRNELNGHRRGRFDATAIRKLEGMIVEIQASVNRFSPEVFGIEDFDGSYTLGFIDLQRCTYVEPQKKGRGPAEDRSDW